MSRLNKRTEAPQYKRRKTEVDAQVGNALIEVKFDVDALRTIRTSIMQLAYEIARHPGSQGFLVLVDSAITEKTLQVEWQSARAVLKPEILNHLTVCVAQEGRYLGIPHDPTLEMQRVLDEEVRKERTRPGSRQTRTDYFFVVLKLLLYRWFTSGEPVTSAWLAQTAGCSYPTVARSLSQLGNLVERKSDRRIGLRYFPREEFSRLLAVSDKLRSTARFVDRSGQQRRPEAHLRRLEKLNLPDLAIGGVLGARHYYPGLDLVGTPRLDLSFHCDRGRVDFGFIEQLDPALKQEDDHPKPADVVVHVVRHKDSLFTPREGGLYWADPIECLLDLHEARLESQASQFLKALQRNRPSAP
jgi:hypothetical protein